MDSFPENRKNSTREQEKHVIDYTLINTSSRRAKQDGRM